MHILKKLCEVFPVTDITLEMGNFDTQVLKAMEEGKPLPEGTDYQHGERYGFDTLREAVFSRDGYTCQCCKKSVKDNAILRVHHIVYRSMGGTDRMSNLVTVCDGCHTPAAHKPGGKLWGWKPKFKGFKGATFMTAVRWQLRDEVKEAFPEAKVHVTYGAATKEARKELGIEKSHTNDAYAMGLFHPKHRSRPKYFAKKRRNNRCLEKLYDAKYVDIRDGKRRSGQALFNGRTDRNHDADTENLHKYRGEKLSAGKRYIRRLHYKLQPHDIVWFEGRKCEISGCHCNGTRAIVLSEKKSVAIGKLKLFRYAGGYYPVASKANRP